MFHVKALKATKYLKTEILRLVAIRQLSTFSSIKYNRKFDEENRIEKQSDYAEWYGFKIFQTNYTMKNIKQRLNNSFIKIKKQGQQYNADRHKILGPDLALAHLLTYYGGKVKFQGNDEWISYKKNSAHLPDKYDPNYILKEIDVSKVEIFYESLENFKNIDYLERATFAGSPLFDDWYVDKISTLFPNLEYLDISDCPKVTERALEALYRSSNLKTVIITNNFETVSFELTAAMLEECMPSLTVIILVPKEKTITI